jgi:hypothetical protein
MKKALLLIALLFTLTACTPEVVGTVVGKDHQFSRWDHYMRSESYACGTRIVSSGTGTSRITYSTTNYCSRLVPDMMYIPERWDLYIKDDKGDTHTIPVNREYYATARDGDHFDNRKK